MRRYTFIVIFLLALAGVANARTAQNWEAYRDLVEFHNGNYPVFNTVLGLAIYEQRSGRTVDQELFVKSRDATSMTQTEEINRLVLRARSPSDFVRRDAIKALAPWFKEFRRAAASAKGVLISLPSEFGSYDFDKQVFLMEGMPTGGRPQKNFPGGLVCSSRVDKLASQGRDMCLYLSNFNFKGHYDLPLKEQLASRVHTMWLRGNIEIYLVAEFDGPMQESEPRSAAAAVQAVRVVGILVLDGKRNILAKLPVNQPRLPGLVATPPLASSLSDQTPTKAAASTESSRKVTRTAAPATKPPHTPGKPIIVDILE